MPDGMTHEESALAAIGVALNTTDLGERQARIAEANVHALLAIAEKLAPRTVELDFTGVGDWKPNAEAAEVRAMRRAAATAPPYPYHGP